MADLLIEKSKKAEWLQKAGTPNALELLGIQVEDLAQKAVQSNMKFKETQEMANAIDPLAAVGDPLGGLTAEPVVATPAAVQAAPVVVENKEVQTQVETPVETPAETSATTVDAAKEVAKEKSAEEVKADEVKELVDALAENLVNPVVEALADMQAKLAEQDVTIKALNGRLEVLQKELQTQGLQIQEETLPRASSSALIKQYIKEKLNPTGAESNTFGKSVATGDPILGKKPAEEKVKEVQQKGTFAGFLDGN